MSGQLTISSSSITLSTKYKKIWYVFIQHWLHSQSGHLDLHISSKVCACTEAFNPRLQCSNWKCDQNLISRTDDVATGCLKQN